MRSRSIWSLLAAWAVVVPWALLAVGEGEGVRVRFAVQSDEPVTVRVTGQVTDAATGQRIAGAMVRVSMVLGRYLDAEVFQKSPYAETTTDEGGQYEVAFVTQLTTSGPLKGKDGVCVSACAVGYETRPVYSARGVGADGVKVDVGLQGGKEVEGTVVDEDGRPLQGAMVRVQTGSNGDWNYYGHLGKTTTGDGGHFRLWCSVDEKLTRRSWLRVDKPGYGTGFFWDVLKEEGPQTFKVPRGGTLVGRVVGGEGRGIGNCEIVTDSGWDYRLEAVTDVDGRYTVSGLPGRGMMSEFYQKKNNRVDPRLLKTTVYARTDAAMNLRDVPQYEITAKEGKTVTGPDLVVGQEAGVSGRLLPSKTVGGAGMMVRLDYDWANMVQADADGRYRFAFVRPGKHRLTAYLPNNLRGDQGLGHAEIDVKAGAALENVDIPLETLSEVRVQFVDEAGEPLEGITAGATWSKSGDGFWTEGMVSDTSGWAVLYVYPDQVQYVRGLDMEKQSLVAEGCVEVKPKAGEVIDNLRVTMLAVGSIRGRLVGPDGQPRAEQIVECRLRYADGVERETGLKTDADGSFKLEKLAPGVLSVAMRTRPLEYEASLGEAFELKPGEEKVAGDVALMAVKMHSVRGQVMASRTVREVEGMKIRVDLDEWEPMAPTDATGAFMLEKVPAGKHRLTAYAPHNLRTDRGVGHVEVEVSDGDAEGVRIPLEELARYEVRVQDPAGRPVAGVAAAAWWTPDHSGVFTEGSKSDQDGRALLYLYPGDEQYVGAHDWDGKYVLREHRKVLPMAGQAMERFRVTVVPNREAE